MRCPFRLDVVVFSFRRVNQNNGFQNIDVTFFRNEDEAWSVWVYAVPKGKGARGNRRCLGSYNSGKAPDPDIAEIFMLQALATINKDENPSN